MGFHNPFLKDGLIKFPDNGNFVKHVEKWAKVRGDKLAYRFLDFSVERDGVVRELNWADFGHATAPSAPACSRSPSPVTAWRSSARRTSITWSRCSAPCTPAASRCRCSTLTSPATSAACTPSSTTATRRPS